MAPRTARHKILILSEIAPFDRESDDSRIVIETPKTNSRATGTTDAFMDRASAASEARLRPGEGIIFRVA